MPNNELLSVFSAIESDPGSDLMSPADEVLRVVTALGGLGETTADLRTELAKLFFDGAKEPSQLGVDSDYSPEDIATIEAILESGRSVNA